MECVDEIVLGLAWVTVSAPWSLRMKEEVSIIQNTWGEAGVFPQTKSRHCQPKEGMENGQQRQHVYCKT